MNVYLASPYTSNDHKLMNERYDQAVDATGFLVQKYPEANIYSPIVSWHNVAVRHNLPRDNSYWKRLDRSFIVLWASHFAVLCLSGWQFSEGILDEYKYKHSQMKTFFVVPMAYGYRVVTKADGEEYESRIARLDRGI